MNEKIAYATREQARARTEAYSKAGHRPRINIEYAGRGAFNVEGDKAAEFLTRFENDWLNPPEVDKIAAETETKKTPDPGDLYLKYVARGALGGAGLGGLFGALKSRDFSGAISGALHGAVLGSIPAAHVGLASLLERSHRDRKAAAPVQKSAASPVETRLKKRQRGWHFEKEPGFHDMAGKFEDAARKNSEVKLAATADALACVGIDPKLANAIMDAPDPIKALTNVLRQSDFGFGGGTKERGRNFSEFASWSGPAGLASDDSAGRLGGSAGEGFRSGTGMSYGGV